MKLLIQLGISIWLVVGTAWGCDEGFIFEPTTREPDIEEINTWSGMVSRTWMMLDGRTLTTVYIITRISTDEEIETLAYPLFYLVKDRKGTITTYIDPEGKGLCSDIRRYN